MDEGEADHRLQGKQLRQNRNNGYKWILLAVIIVYNIISGLIFTSTSVLFAEYVFYFKVSKAEVGWSLSIHMALHFMSGIFFSGPLKKYGGKPIAFIGGILLVSGLFLSSWVTSIYVLYITQGVLTGIGNSMVETTAYLMIQQHFDKNRALAAGLSSMGFNIGNFIGPILMQGLVEMYGWRGSLVLLAGIIAHMIPLSLTFRRAEKDCKSSAICDQNKDLNREPAYRGKCGSIITLIFKDAFDFSLLRTPSYTLFCIGGGFLYRFTHVSFVHHFTSRAMHVGTEKQTAAFFLSMFFLTATLSRLSISFISNLKCVSVQLVFTLGVGLSVAANAMMIALPSFYGPLVSALTFGLSVGFANTVFPVVLVEVQGTENLVRSFALFYFILGFGALLGTPFMGLMQDISDSYDVPYYINTAIGTVAISLCLTMLVLQHRKEKRVRKGSEPS